MTIILYEDGIHLTPYRDVVDARCRPFGVSGIRRVGHVFARDSAYGPGIKRIWPPVNISGRSFNTLALSSATTNTEGAALGIRFAPDGGLFRGFTANGQSISQWDSWSPVAPTGIIPNQWAEPINPNIGNVHEIFFATGQLSGTLPVTFSLAREQWHSLAQNCDMVISIPTGLRAVGWNSEVTIRRNDFQVSATISMNLEIQ